MGVGSREEGGGKSRGLCWKDARGELLASGLRWWPFMDNPGLVSDGPKKVSGAPFRRRWWHLSLPPACR